MSKKCQAGRSLLLYHFACEVETMKEGTREYYERRILNVQIHIQNHLDDDLSLDELAGVACFSPYHFHRIFRGMVGESVKEYVRRLRLERTAGELMHRQRPVTQIALDAGYETHESFTRAFRAMFDMSPSGFRSDFRKGAARLAAVRSEKTTATSANKGDVKMEVTIQKFDAIKVAFVRHVGPYKECEAAWGKLCSAPAVMMTMGPDTLMIGICYDDPDITEAGKIRYDACATVPADFVAPDGIETQTIAAGEYAVTMHKGSYDGLHDTYRNFFGEWFPASGREPASSPSLEIYRNSPDSTPPDELLTEIRVPLT